MDGVAKIVALSCGAKKGLFSCAKMWFWEDWWYWFDVIHLFIAAWLLESPDLFSSFSYNCIFPLKKNSWRWKSIRSKAIYCFPSEIRTVSASSKPKKTVEHLRSTFGHLEIWFTQPFLDTDLLGEWGDCWPFPSSTTCGSLGCGDIVDSWRLWWFELPRNWKNNAANRFFFGVRGVLFWICDTVPPFLDDI